MSTHDNSHISFSNPFISSVVVSRLLSFFLQRHNLKGYPDLYRYNETLRHSNVSIKAGPVAYTNFKLNSWSQVFLVYFCWFLHLMQYSQISKLSHRTCLKIDKMCQLSRKYCSWIPTSIMKLFGAVVLGNLQLRSLYSLTTSCICRLLLIINLTKCGSLLPILFC